MRQNVWKNLMRYPSAVIGLSVVALLVLISIIVLITIPYNEAVRLWRGGESVWYQNPKTAPPAWMNWFSAEDLPASFLMNTQDETVPKTVETSADGSTITYTFEFDFNYDDFPQDLVLFMSSNYQEKLPFVSLTWLTPDGREIRVADFGVDRGETYRFAPDERLERRLGRVRPSLGLFAAPESDPPVPVKGTYQLVMETKNFEAASEVQAEFVMYGQLHGWAGTDHLRRDLGVALLWGIPVALAFGLLAAVGTSVLTMIIAAVGVWYGGWVDDLIQRLTEVNLVLPLLPILVMIGTLYSRSIWVILGVTILLFIFGAGIKSFRAIFLQVKESTYIEAARAYGTSNSRIIFVYLIPRIIPILIPGLVSSIPAFVFLEASLAVLGLGDPVLSTWGKLINDAQNNGALFQGNYYWILEPAVLLMVTGLAFAMLGYSLDRIFNPRLREL